MNKTIVGELFKVMGGGTPPTSTAAYWDGDIPWITSADIDEQLNVKPRKYITKKAINNSATNLVPAGSVIVVTRVGLGKVAIAPFDLCFSQDCQALLLDHSQYDTKYMAYQLKKAVGIFKHISRGTTISGVTKKQLLDLEIIVPPIDEQKQIVAEIEKQFTRLDAGVAALKRLQNNLKRYRASVLKAACEGKLVPTEAELARQEGRTFEPASVLLERILKERREKWMEQHPGKKYVEPKGPDTSNLPELPEGWGWACFEQLSTRVTVGHVGPMKNEYVPVGIPFLRSQNVRENRFDPEGLLYITKEFHKKLSKSIIHKDDIVVVRSGSVGVTCVIPDALEEANCADLVIIQQPLGIIPQLGAFYMNSLARRFIESGKVGVALTHFNTKSVASMPVTVPPKFEQRRIVDEVARRISVIEELELAVEANIKRATRMRQAVLQRAFEGELIK